MATIEYNPAAWEQQGSSTYNDRWDDGSGKTEVVAEVVVENAGNADGYAVIRIIDSKSAVIGTSGNRPIPAGPALGTPGEPQTLTAKYLLTNDAQVQMAVVVLDAGTGDELGRVAPFTVNSYEVPKAADLEISGQISIDVV